MSTPTHIHTALGGKKRTPADSDAFDLESAADASFLSPHAHATSSAEAPYGHASILRVLRDRFGVLASLLVLQSLSSLVLQRYEQLLEHHIEITLFLTMVVGAGGNASNQSAVDVIRGLATGAIRPWRAAAEQCNARGATGPMHALAVLR